MIVLVMCFILFALLFQDFHLNFFLSYRIFFVANYRVGLLISPRLLNNFSFVSISETMYVTSSLTFLFFLFLFFPFATVYHIFFCQHNFSSCTHNEKHLIFDSLTSLQIHTCYYEVQVSRVHRQRERERERERER